MEEKKNAAIGFGVIAVIIVVIVGVVMAVLPEEPETAQSEIEKIVSEKELEKVEPSDNIEFDPEMVKMAEKNIPDMQAIFREVLERCNAVDSYSDYLVLGEAMFVLQDEMVQSVEVTDHALSILEVLGYDKHPTVGPLIGETRQLIGDSGDCVRDLVNKYEN